MKDNPASTETFSRQTAPSDLNQDAVSVNANGEMIEHLKAYAKERPDVAALWCLGIGFVLGWKLKPW